MNSSRLAIVTRRFWPVAGPTEMAIADLAAEAKSNGVDVDVFTSQWEKSWPQDLNFRNFQVQRVPKPFKGFWGSFRYLRALTRRIAEFEPDAILTYGVGEESWAVGRPFKKSAPVAVRMDQPLLNQLRSAVPIGQRAIETFRLSRAIITDCQSTSDALTHYLSDVSPNILDELEHKLQVVPDAPTASTSAVRTFASQSAARSSLSDTHPVLITEPGQPLVVCAASLNSDPGVFDLLNAWPNVLKRYPKSRLWIVGDGALGPKLWNEITDRDLVYSVIMPGFFDNLSEVFQAADLYVHPLHNGGRCGNLDRAIHAGLCCVTTAFCDQTGDQADAAEHLITDLAVPPRQPDAISHAIIEALADSKKRTRLGRAGQRRAEATLKLKVPIQRLLDAIHTPVAGPTQTVD